MNGKKSTQVRRPREKRGSFLASQTYLSANRQKRMRREVRSRASEISQTNEKLIRDIGKRKRIEAELRASEKRLADLLDVAPDAIIAINQDKRLIVFNKAAEIMFGYRADEVLNKPLDLLLPDRYANSHSRHVMEYLIEPTVIKRMGERVPVWGRRQDGSEFPAEASISKVAEDGKTTLTAIIRDVTERKEAEEALRMSESRNQALIDAIPDLILRINRDGNYLDVRAEKESNLLTTPEAAIGTNLRDLPIPVELAEQMIRNIEKVIQENTVDTTEFSLELVQGIQVYEARTVKSGENEVVAIIRNITDRKRMEAELSEREKQYRSIFESVSDALFINDMETGELVDFNPAASRMHGYTDEEFRQLEVAGFIHPNSKHLFEEYLRTVREGGVFRDRAVDIRKDGSNFPIEVLGTSIVYRGKPYTLGVVRDITEETKALQLLEERVAQRTRELHTLLEISRNVTSTLDLKTLLRLMLDQIKTIIGFSGMTVWMVENEDKFLAIEYEGPEPEERLLQRRWRQMEDRDVINLSDLQEPVIIPDVTADTTVARAWRNGVIEILGEVPDYIASWMGVPLLVKNRMIGLLTFKHEKPDFFTPQHADLALALANHAAVAIENARLFHSVQRGAGQFRAVSEIGQHLTSILDEEQLLTQTVHLIQKTFGYYHVHIGLIKGDVVVFPATAGVFDPDPVCNYCAPMRLRIGQDGVCGWVAGTGEPLIVPDISQEPRYLHPEGGVTGSGVIVPLKVKGEVIGVLDVENRQVNAFDESDVAVLQLFASQVAVAIENARLYQQAQRLAALQERQKLARELHDSVSQALYGLALGTRTARSLLDIDPARAAEPLEYCLSLAEAGLAEMRALIFELRPESLENEGLVAALMKQADAIRARYNLEVKAEFCPEPDIPLALKESLYRVVQEAMHNTVKHAGATHLEVKLHSNRGRVSLDVCDNGSGFNPQQEFHGHLGLKSMRERVERLNGAIEIESAPGQGTRIHAWVPKQSETVSGDATKPGS